MPGRPSSRWPGPPGRAALPRPRPRWPARRGQSRCPRRSALRRSTSASAAPPRRQRARPRAPAARPRPGAAPRPAPRPASGCRGDRAAPPAQRPCAGGRRRRRGAGSTRSAPARWPARQPPPTAARPGVPAAGVRRLRHAQAGRSVGWLSSGDSVCFAFGSGAAHLSRQRPRAARARPASPSSGQPRGRARWLVRLAQRSPGGAWLAGPVFRVAVFSIALLGHRTTVRVGRP
jgi:hypothetical protein